MKVHVLKTWPEHFAEVYAGRKTFELRHDDRDFQVGDLLALVEFDLAMSGYSGMFTCREITHKLDGFQGVAPGYTILSLGLMFHHCGDGEKIDACQSAVERYFEEIKTNATAVKGV